MLDWVWDSHREPCNVKPRPVSVTIHALESARQITRGIYTRGGERMMITHCSGGTSKKNNTRGRRLRHKARPQSRASTMSQGSKNASGCAGHRV